MSFDKQVSETCKACFFHIRALRHIRASLITEASETIAAAIVGSRLRDAPPTNCHRTAQKYHAAHLKGVPSEQLRSQTSNLHAGKHVPTKRVKPSEVPIIGFRNDSSQ